MPDPRDLNLQFEPQEPFDTTQECYLSGGMVVAAAVIGMGSELGPQPALMFRFVDETGHFMPPIALVLDTAAMDQVPSLVSEAAKRAVEAANQKRGEE